MTEDSESSGNPFVFLKRFFSFRKSPLKNIDYNKIEDSQKEMIKGILDLSSMNAREIMVPRVDITAISVTEPLNEIADVILEAGHSRIPVYDGRIDNICGILYAKDLLEFIAEPKKKFEIKKILRKPLFIPETMPLNELLIEFKKRHQHLAIVVDEYGGIAGLVTMENVLEEIVGDIIDEFDENEPAELVKINRTTYEIDSRMSLYDLNDTLSLSLPAEEFDTIGGLLLDIFGKIPAKNETIEKDGILYKVKDIKGTRIVRILMTISAKKSKNQ
ncbi:MAG TPA: hemolysin family protein [Spirochaetota bacterium]|jgi:CBS domain containing-hemolysin-like protein|nr:HlyC/CorC family transporter [Spirochaetota bacterium]HOA07757.1 hemolysin family protein [Spirochaetota bacterium]HPJ14631.1 hemolysin family protein [Spirochaetota bacterium]HPM34292.1 hemolysin family protein [Spirochaetota bacterium]HPY03533.1 hemolysin family protein [Spirochaetota bacterium]